MAEHPVSGHSSSGLHPHQEWQPSRVRRALFSVLRFLYVVAIPGLPLAGLIALFLANDALWYRCLIGGLAPLLYALGFVVVAGVLSVPHQRGIIPGQFPRRFDHPVYFHRRLYGICWTTVYYCPPIYDVCLNVPWLKALLFRLFGYHGNLDFTIYPDTWIRDLPLLDFGPGVYVSNRVTLGTNMVLPNHHILVHGISLRERALIGHFALVGPGVTVGEGTEIGVCASIGVYTTIGDRVHIGPLSGVGHEVTIGSRAHIGGGSIIDTRAMVAEGAHLPAGTIVAAGAVHGFLHPEAGPEPSSPPRDGTAGTDEPVRFPRIEPGE